VVIEYGNLALVVIDKLSVMLPSYIDCITITKVLELVRLAAKSPDYIAVRPIYERDGEEMTARNKIITVVGLGYVSLCERTSGSLCVFGCGQVFWKVALPYVPH
jgi:hypothetical protein